MTEELKATLRGLAEKYEVCSFCDEDPSQFLRWYGDPDVNFKTEGAATGVGANLTDVETASFIAAMLAFGNRKQFIPKISYILGLADKTSGSISNWILSGDYKSSFQTGSKKFYRFYSYDDMHDFFGDLRELLKEGDNTGMNANLTAGANATGVGAGLTAGGTATEVEVNLTAGGGAHGALGEAFRRRWERACAENGTKVLLADIVSDAFPHSSIVPKGKNTANKRIHMFLRWMVRQNSPVDLGLWDWYDPSGLLIPLDVHVMAEGIKLGLLPETARATRKTAIALTESLKEIWPQDPCKGDFALFGLGVDK